MIVKVEALEGGLYRVTLPSGEMIETSIMSIDGEEPRAPVTYVEAFKVELEEDEEGKEVWIFTVVWALETALFNHEKRMRMRWEK
ncbi:MAG: hypothetical protein QXT28_09285 [Thermofilaceae archaeon]